MASTKEYGYYIEGNKIALVQRDTSFDNDANSRDYGPGSDKFQWKSPLESITEGLEVLYTYVPNYKEVNTASKSAGQPKSYKASTQTGKLYLNFDNGVNYDGLKGTWILLGGAGRWNGIHKINSGGSNFIQTETNYSEGSSTTNIDFGSRISFQQNIIVMEDETYELDLPIYLQKALIYYIKAKLFEDIGDMKMREFFNREFKRQVEKHNNGRVPGLRMVSTGSSAIK